MTITDNEIVIFGVFGLVTILIINRMGEDMSVNNGELPGATIFEPAEKIVNQVVSGVRGLRNNNPGNIEKNSIAWEGLSPVQSDSRFFQFTSMEYGIRAIAVIMKTYRNKYGLRTVTDIVGKWAPPTENDTMAYTSAVSGDLGVSPDDDIDVAEPVTMFSLVRAIIKHENGFAASALISDDTVAKGIALA